MASTVTKYQIFLASPSDLKEERDAVGEVINELNLTFAAQQNGIILELLKWETHSAPAASLNDVQTVINTDLGEDYDLFIGLLWKKFGTPTTSANSGTEEEFNRAHKRFLDSPNSLQILFYFKMAPPKLMSEIEPNELQKINDFKDRIGGNGILYSEFSTIDELQKYLRLHIPKRIFDLSKKKPEVIQVPPTTFENGKSPYEEKEFTEEYGIIDYQEIINESFGYSTEALKRIASSTEWITKEIQKKTEEVELIHSSGNQHTHVLRDFFTRTAKVMNDYADMISPEPQIFISNFDKGTKAYTDLINLYRADFENKEDEIDQAGNALGTLIISLPGGIEGMKKFLMAIKALPRMTKEFNSAKGNVENKLGNLISDLERSYAIAVEIQKNIHNK